MTWFKVDLKNEDVLNGKVFSIQNEYEKIFMLNSAPKEAAIFASRYPNKENITTIYFSPEAARISKAILTLYKFQACDKPNKDEVALLIGNTTDWDLLEK